jgi:hypothetical protein
MSTQTFSSVASHVVGQYGQVGKLVIGAYRVGAQRLVSGANARYAQFLTNRSLPLVNAAVKTSLINVQNRIAGLIESGIATGSDRADRAVDLVAGGVSGGIERVAATAARVESAFNTTALSTVGSLTLPVAQVSLAIANRAVDGTKRLSARVIGVQEQAQPKVKRAARVVKRAAKKTVKTVRRAKAHA